VMTFSMRQLNRSLTVSGHGGTVTTDVTHFSEQSLFRTLSQWAAAQHLAIIVL